MRRWVAVLLTVGIVSGLAGCTGHREVPPPPSTLSPSAEPARAAGREFGIAADPWNVDEWASVVGAHPTMVMEFEQWSRNRTIDSHLTAAHEHGLSSFMICWEPWQSVPAEAGIEAQYADQPTYSNASIASGRLDDYIRSFARSVKAAKLTVYMRYAHEMNGSWYPWSRDPAMYVQAWRHVVDIFRQEGAANAKWVFSMHPSLYDSESRWLKNVERYWPGADYVDYLGTTLINFGGTKETSVAQYAKRLTLMHRTFGGEVIVTELNTAAKGRVAWLSDLRTWLDSTPWIRGVVLSQQSSRAQTQLGKKVGDLSWDVLDDPETQPVVKGIVEDLTSPAAEPSRQPADQP